jgi:ATP-dependent Clp protease ATP-binding subunit ClpC
MTSNLGSDLIKRETAMGFSVMAEGAQTDESAYGRMKDKVMDEVKRFFRPEFLNRIDSTVVFHQLKKEEILSIVDLMMDQVRDELSEKEVDLELTQEAKEYLGEKGFDPVLGARPLRRLIQNEIEDRLSDEILSGRLTSGDVAVVELEDNTIRIGAKIGAAVPKAKKGAKKKEEEEAATPEETPEEEPAPAD